MPKKKQEKTEEENSREQNFKGKLTKETDKVSFEEEKAEVKEKTKKVSQEEYEKRVLQLAEQGLTAEKIGEKLRKEGIHPSDYNKKISKILGGKYTNPDRENITRKLSKIEEHFKKNKGDKRAMRERARVSAQLRRLNLYLNK